MQRKRNAVPIRILMWSLVSSVLMILCGLWLSPVFSCTTLYDCCFCTLNCFSLTVSSGQWVEVESEVKAYHMGSTHLCCRLIKSGNTNIIQVHTTSSIFSETWQSCWVDGFKPKALCSDISIVHTKIEIEIASVPGIFSCWCSTPHLQSYWLGKLVQSFIRKT